LGFARSLPSNGMERDKPLMLDHIAYLCQCVSQPNSMIMASPDWPTITYPPLRSIRGKLTFLRFQPRVSTRTSVEANMTKWLVGLVGKELMIVCKVRLPKFVRSWKYRHVANSCLENGLCEKRRFSRSCPHVAVIRSQVFLRRLADA
jgi:hypothetical protein